MDAIRRLARNRPFWVVVVLAIMQPLLAIPFVAFRKLGGPGITPLQVITATVQSAAIL